MSMKSTLLVASLAFFCAKQARGQLIINELMQSNVDCIMDDLNEFPDSWVELYNAGDASVNLNQYSIALENTAANAWKLPSRTISPGQFVVVYCDKEAKDLHTDFKLESGKGGSIFLFRDGTVADYLENMAKQPAPNIAYGRQTDGSTTWGYQQTPTPGTQNCGEICQRVLGDPVFSETGKVISDNRVFDLSLLLPKDAPEGAEIRVTMNGSEPTESSLKYLAPLRINSSRIVKAKIFCKGWLSPPAVTQSYIYFPRELTLPVISIAIDNRYLNDSKIGIYVEGNYENGKKNYQFNWRRPMNFEYFETAETGSILNQLCETRVQGGASRDAKLKSLIVYANKRFGKKRLKYEFFPDQRPGQDNFKSLLLRNAGNDFDYLYMRDAVIQRTMSSHTDLDWQAWRPAIVFINGTYKGILNIRERSTADNIFTNYDELEDIDMIENWWEVKEGDYVNFKQFQDFYAEHGHTLAEYSQWMDWEEYINLMVMNLYYNNQDFPGNNIVMWRPRSAGGRWRFVAKDTDFGLGLYGSPANYKTIDWLYNPDYDSGRNWANHWEHTRLFRRMMEDGDFAREFIDRAAIYMGDFMNERGTRAVWDPMYEMIREEYPFHRELINKWWPNYNEELNSARNWLSQRTDYFYKQLADYYHLGTPSRLIINMPEQNSDVFFNGVKLSTGRFDGKFFSQRNVTLTCTPKEGYETTGWRVTLVGNNGVVTNQEISGAVYSFTMPQCNNYVVVPIIGETDGIRQNTVPSWRWHREGERLVVENVGKGVLLVLYDLRGVELFRTRADGETVQMPMKGHGVYLLKVGDKTVKVQ